MTGSDEDLGWSRRPGAEDRRWLGIGRVLGGRTMERSSDAVCTVHKEMMSAGFLVDPQNQGRRVSWLSLKTKFDGFLG
jgi:hypothetical protein